MRRPRYGSFALVVLLLAAWLTVALSRGVAQLDSPEERRISILVEQLGDDSYERREAAGKELEELSDQALPALREAVDSNDPEVRLRARQLIRAIGLQLRTSKTTGLVMVAIEAGEFSMGSPAEESGRQAEETLHKVKISRPFLLGVHEVTQGQYETVIKANPSYYQPLAAGKARVTDRDTSNYPVETVSWLEAVDFCNRLSKLDGFTPYYSVTETTVEVVGGKGYRLPTEAEWEYACRAGAATPFWFGAENTGREANVKPVMVPGGYGEGPKWGAAGRPVAVGSYPANHWGLHDMHGNVAEWCWDWYDRDFYKRSPRIDPMGPATGGQRVLRGGSWMVLEGSCRSASRFCHPPSERKNYLGFRVARDQ